MKLEGSPRAKRVRSVSYRGKSGEIALHTEKVLDMTGALPVWSKAVLGEGFLDVLEETWIDFPRTKTVYTTKVVGTLVKVVVDTVYEGIRGCSSSCKQCKRYLRRVETDLPQKHSFVRKKPKRYEISMEKCIRYEKHIPNKENPSTVPTTFTANGAKHSIGPLTASWRNKYSVTAVHRVVHIKTTSSLIRVVEPMLIQSILETYSKFHRLFYLWAPDWSCISLDDAWALEGADRTHVTNDTPGSKL